MMEEVEKYYADMENELLLNIAKKISADKPMEIDKWDLESNAPIVGSGGVNEWQLERLKELNGLNSENAKIIAKYSGKTVEQIEKIFQRAREIGTSADEEMLKMGIKAGILNEVNPKYEDIIVKDIVNRAVKNTLTTFNDVNNSLLASAGDNYRKIVNNISSQVMSGMKTIDKAMQEAVSKLAEEGLTGFTARNGTNWSPEAYIKMVMKTNSQNTINNIQEERLKLRGCDYVEISSHSGARPLCADDQGQIFSLSGNTEPITDGAGKTIKVRSWSSSSYGKPAGILGINCGHSRYGFVPGLSIHRENKITRAENDKEYIEQQHQRLYERSIRNKKREIEMLKVSNASEDYIKLKKDQLRNYNNQYRTFLKETGRYRRSTNEYINKSFTNKNNDNINKNYREWRTKRDKVIKKSIVGKLDVSKFTKNIKTIDNDIILLEERIKHIKERHPEVIKYVKDIPNILNDPDIVLQELKHEDTIWVIKQLDKNVKITIKLNTSNDENIKNSIIQMQFMRNSEIQRNIRNNKVNVIFDKNEKK